LRTVDDATRAAHSRHICPGQRMARTPSLVSPTDLLRAYGDAYDRRRDCGATPGARHRQQLTGSGAQAAGALSPHPHLGAGAPGRMGLAHPALHHAARHGFAGLVAEQGSFLVCGLLIWLSAFGGGLAYRSERAGAGVAALLLTSMHMTLLGALLALAPRPLYPHVAQFAGLTQLEDQHLGGAIMLVVGGVSYLGGGLWLTASLVRRATRGRQVLT
jgi:Cytochrome c oxidase caa3 assembly factor (Caa3_CtaG)